MDSYDLADLANDDIGTIDETYEEDVDKVLNLTVINTNARSICPKIESFVTCMEELDASFGIVSETWLTDGKELDDDLLDLRGRAEIGALTRNRPPNEQGYSHGGIGIFFDVKRCSFEEIAVTNPGDYEVLVAKGRFVGFSRPVLAVACYLPPGYTNQRGGTALQFICDTVTDLKRRFNDPFVVVSGDFNQWKIDDALADHIDLLEVDVGVSRGNRKIDRLFTNLPGVHDKGTLPALAPDLPDAGAPSDHLVTFAKFEIPRIRTFKWLSYSYRYLNEESTERFKTWVVMHDWAEVLAAEGSQAKALAYQRAINMAVETCFPLITMRRKSTDPPWINNKARRLMRRKKAEYRNHGRSKHWRRMRHQLEKLLKERKKKYESSQKIRLLASDGERHFFKNVKNYQNKSRPEPFDVRTIFPGKSDQEVVTLLARHFNKISHEFSPLQPSEVPRTYRRPLLCLLVHQVAGRLRKFRKPKSMVPGDLFPELVTKFSGSLRSPSQTFITR